LPGEISKVITIPTYTDGVTEGKAEKVSLAIQQVESTDYPQEIHLAFDSNQKSILSGFHFDGREISLRADTSGDSDSTLTLQLRKRDSADSPRFSATRELTLADFQQTGNFTVPGQDFTPLPLDQDGLTNQQISTRLRLNLEAGSDQPLVSVLGPELQFQSSVQLLNGNTVRFSQDAPLTSWRADSGPDLVTFGLKAGATTLTLISNAQGGSAGSLTPDNADNENAANGWQTTEGRAIGSRSIVASQNLSNQDWTPTASRNGVPLELLNLVVDGNQVTATFTGGVTSVFWQATGNASSIVPAPVEVEVQRLARFNNSLGFYKVDSITGTVDGLNPGDTGYLQAALARSQDDDLLLDAGRLPGFGASATFNSLPLDTRERYGVLLVQNGDRSVIFSSFAAANPGGATQMVSLSNSPNSLVLGIEDLSVARGLSDNDFNDVILTVKNVSLGLF
jgi:hypothetical protein